jgi:hypothetical protein
MDERELLRRYAAERDAPSPVDLDVAPAVLAT